MVNELLSAQQPEFLSSYVAEILPPQIAEKLDPKIVKGLPPQVTEALTSHIDELSSLFQFDTVTVDVLLRLKGRDSATFITLE